LAERYVARLRSPEQPFVVESDISAYDLNLSLDATDMLDDLIASLTSKPAAALSLLRRIRRTPIAMPDPSNVGEQRKAVVVTGDIMMPSGIKLTAEYGTLCNVAVTIAWQIQAGWRESRIIDYWDVDDTKQPITWLIQGDDKAVINPDLRTAARQVTQEAELYGLIGVSGKVAISDRFLQKHMYLGMLAPVAGRMVQQRLCNENAPESLEQYTMGVTSSLVGFNGYVPSLASSSITATDSSMGVRPLKELPPAVLRWQKRTLRMISDNLQRAAVPPSVAIEFINELAKDAPNHAKLYEMNKTAATDLTNFMLKKKADDAVTALSKLLLFFDRYKYSATIAGFFDELAGNSDTFAEAAAEYERKKVAFANRAYEIIGLNKQMFM
jgi:hypothetical protein